MRYNRCIESHSTRTGNIFRNDQYTQEQGLQDVQTVSRKQNEDHEQDDRQNVIIMTCIVAGERAN